MTVQAQEVSDNPYPSMSGNPYRASNQVSNPAGAGAEPQMPKRTDDVSGRTVSGRAASML